MRLGAVSSQATPALLGVFVVVTSVVLQCCGQSSLTSDHPLTAANPGAKSRYEVTTESYHSSNDSDNHSNDSHSNDSHDEHSVHRYHVASWAFSRVQTPFIIGAWLVLAMILKIVFHMKIRGKGPLSASVPESCLLILLGLLLGIILYLSNERGYSLDSDMFFLYLLPPIILDAGYHMPARAFFANIGSILLFAVLGTLWNAFLIGLSLWGFSQSGGIGAIKMHIGILECLLFGTLLAAVDPVAVLAVFEQCHVNEVLNIVVFAESLLNDGITVVLYHIFEGFLEIGEGNVIAADIVAGVFSIPVVILCSLLIGLLFGFFAALLSKYSDHVRVIEPLVVFVMGYLSYLAAEVFHFSGILSCTACAMFMQKYVEKNISHKSHTTIKYFMKMLAQASETIIFMLIGFSTVNSAHNWDTGFVLLTLVFCLLYRSLGVLFGCWILNKRRLEPISSVDQVIMAYGGLRGAIAFSLVVIINDKHVPDKNLFITTTVVIVYFTNLIMGSTIKPLVNMLHIKRQVVTKPSMNEKLNGRLLDHIMAGIEDISGRKGDYVLREKFTAFSNKVLKPILLRDNKFHQSGRSLVSVYEKLTEKEAYECIHRSGSFVMSNSMSASTMNLKDLSVTRTNSLAKFFEHYTSPDDAEPTSSSEYYVTKNNHLAPPQSVFPRPEPTNGTVLYTNTNRRGSEICLDMGVLEPGEGTIHRVDTEIHHLLDEAMFKPRQLFTKADKYQVDDDNGHKPYHHKDRLKLRKLISKHMQKRPGGKEPRLFTAGRGQRTPERERRDHGYEKRNEDGLAPKSSPINIKKQKSHSISMHKSSPHLLAGISEDGEGDCLHSSLKSTHSPSRPRKSVSFVFAEGEVPEQHPHKLMPKIAVDPKHQYSSRKRGSDYNTNHQEPNHEQKPNHQHRHFPVEKFPLTPPQETEEGTERAVFHLPKDSDSDSEQEGISFKVTPPDDEGKFTWGERSKPEESAPQSPPPAPTIAETSFPWKRATRSPPLRRKHESETDAPNLSERAGEDGRDPDSDEPSLAAEASGDEEETSASRGDQMWDTVLAAMNFNTNNSSEGSHPRGEGHPQTETSTPLQSLMNPIHDASIDDDRPSTPEESAVLPLPWLSGNRDPAQLDTHWHSPTESPPVTFHIPSDESGEDPPPIPTEPPPQSSAVDKPKEKEPNGAKNKAKGPSFPLPWRENGASAAPIRSPSVAHELDSIKPQYSCHSIYMSEAESHHSQPMHYTTPLIHTGSGGPRSTHSSHPQLPSLDPLGHLPEEETDFTERIQNWILESDPDTMLPVHDTDFAGTDLANGNLQVTSLKHKAPHEPSEDNTQESVV